MQNIKTIILATCVALSSISVAAPEYREVDSSATGMGVPSQGPEYYYIGDEPLPSTIAQEYKALGASNPSAQPTLSLVQSLEAAKERVQALFGNLDVNRPNAANHPSSSGNLYMNLSDLAKMTGASHSLGRAGKAKNQFSGAASSDSLTLPRSGRESSGSESTFGSLYSGSSANSATYQGTTVIFTGPLSRSASRTSLASTEVAPESDDEVGSVKSAISYQSFKYRSAGSTEFGTTPPISPTQSTDSGKGSSVTTLPPSTNSSEAYGRGSTTAHSIVWLPPSDSTPCAPHPDQRRLALQAGLPHPQATSTTRQLQAPVMQPRAWVPAPAVQGTYSRVSVPAPAAQHSYNRALGLYSIANYNTSPQTIQGPVFNMRNAVVPAAGPGRLQARSVQSVGQVNYGAGQVVKINSGPVQNLIPMPNPAYYSRR